jgi:hypothetical protein
VKDCFAVFGLVIGVVIIGFSWSLAIALPFMWIWNYAVVSAIEIDPPYEPPARWSMFAVAEDFIRRGGNYEDGTEVVGGLGSVDGDGRHYCDRCSGRKAT